MDMSVQQWRRGVDTALAAHRVARANLRSARAALAERDEAFWTACDAGKLVQVVAEQVQEAAHARIAGVVCQCLQAVFDDPYEFKIVFDRARGRTEARMVFVRDGDEINPIDSSGGGVIDVAAFALRLSCIMLSRPASRRVVVLDEPFRFVSEGYRPRVRAMLLDLAGRLGVQFIMVTHIKELAIGTVVEMAQ